jgi:hypothetical protein
VKPFPDPITTFKKRQNGRRKLVVAICVFAVAALASTAYAIGSGWFVMQGVVARTENISVRFVNAGFAGTPRSGEQVFISAADDHRNFSITTQLMMPGDYREVAFQVQNTGNQAIRLINVQTEAEDAATSGLAIFWPDDLANSPNLSNHVLVSGATSDVFRIRIAWDPNAVNVPTGTFRNFSLTMNYQSAMLPLGDV